MSPNPPGLRHQWVEDDRIRALKVALGSSFKANLAVGVLLVAVLTAFYDWERLALWFLGLVLVQRYRRVLELLGLARRKVPGPDVEVRQRVQRFEVDSFLLALWWGSTVFWFFNPQEQGVQLAVAHALGGVTLVSLGVHAYHPQVMRWFIPVVILPFVLRCFAQFDLHHAYVGGGMLLMNMYLLLYGKHLSKVVRQAIELRHENSDLVRELRQQALQLQEANDAKSRFLAAASHDLRQPAHAVGLLAAALQPRIAEPSQQALMDKLQVGVGHFCDVVNEVLDIARIDVEESSLAIQPVPLEPLIERIESAFHEAARAKGLALLIRLPTHVAPCVKTDPACLWRIVSNLVANAVKYTQEGAVLIAVRPAVMGAESAWRIEVRDSGPGIAAEHQALIFEEFFQVSNPARDRRHGLGLGLAVARRMAQSLGNDIALRSCPGNGSVFSITLPACERTMQAVEVVTDLGDVGLQGLQVLAIDDDEMAREGMDSLLTPWGVQTRTAGSVAAACALVEDGFIPDALITDHWLGGQDNAFVAIETVRAAMTARGVPAEPLRVMVCSGDIRPDTREVIEARGWTFAQKPLRPDQLRAWLQRL